MCTLPETNSKFAPESLDGWFGRRCLASFLGRKRPIFRGFHPLLVSGAGYSLTMLDFAKFPHPESVKNLIAIKMFQVIPVDGNQKSGINSPVEGTVVEIPLFTRFYTSKRW